MARLSNRNHADNEAAIDLTPMLDVVFIMLIFFIVTASFVKESGVLISRPESSSQQNPSDNNNILIQLTANNEVWLDGRRIDIRSVRANIERLHAEHPEAAVIVQADEKSKNRAYVLIADQAREAGVYDISMNLAN